MPHNPPEMHPLISLMMFLTGLPRLGFVDTITLFQERTAGAVIIVIQWMWSGKSALRSK